MTRKAVDSHEIHGMNMGLKSTGLVMPKKIKVDPILHEGISTYIPHVDRIFGKLIPGQVVVLSGVKGSGKTTFLLQLLEHISYGQPEDLEDYADHYGDEVLAGLNNDEKTCAYISAEERLDFLRVTKTDRIGIENVALANEANVENIQTLLRENDIDVVVIDSYQSLWTDMVSGPRKTLDYVANALVQIAKETNTTMVIITHCTTTGQVKGGTKLLHQCDTTIHIDKAGGPCRMITTEKNRMGESGQVYLNMLDDGYDMYEEAAPASDEDDEDSGDSRLERKRQDCENLTDAIEKADTFDADTLAQVVRDLDMDMGRAKRLLREMEEAGDIVKSGTRHHNFEWSMA